jgi:hypothetical protein
MSNGNLGPLPKSDRNDALQELSFRAFENLFPIELFRIRNEPGKDMGVDKYIEVKAGSFDTNLRSQVQLKAEETAEKNTDGSISKSIETSNANYLLNGPCPMYVLYIADTEELYYAWIREEAEKGFVKKDHNWQQADSVTIRFHKKLDATALNEIRDKITLESRRSREIHARLTTYSISETPRIEIGKNLTVIDSHSARNIIESAGASFVSTGFAKRIVELSDLLTSQDKKAKKIAVILAYAHFSMNRYDLAAGYLKEAAAATGSITPSDSLLLEELKNNCEFRLGRKSKLAFEETEKALSHLQSNALRAYAELDKLKREHARTKRGEQSQAVLEKMRAALEIVKNGDGTSRNLSLSAEATLLFSTGHDIISLITLRLGTLAIQADLPTRGMPSARSQVAALFSQWARWFEKANELLTQAAGAKNPIVVAETLYTRGAVVSLFLINSLVASEIKWIELDETFGGLLKQAYADIERAIEMYVTADMPELKMHSQLVLADLHDIAGRSERSIEIATEVEAISRAMEYKDLSEQANEIVQGNSHLRKLRRDLHSVDTTDIDELFIATTDEKARSMAESMARTMGLPPDRIPNLIPDLLSSRELAIERRDWCRHLEIIQQLAHTASVDTAYTEIPKYGVICKLLGLNGEESQDWAALIPRFKAFNCINCPYRAPKGGESAGVS